LKKYIQVGIIINTHGLKGEVKVSPLTDNQNRFTKLKKVFVESTNSVEADIINNSRELNIENVKFFKDKTILKFREINDVDQAFMLKNYFLVIDMEDAVKLPPDTFFIFELIGCNVYDENQKSLGKIVDIIHTGSNDVYVVRDVNNKELLIPARKKIVKSVEINEKKIIVQLPEGL